MGDVQIKPGTWAETNLPLEFEAKIKVKLLMCNDASSGGLCMTLAGADLNDRETGEKIASVRPVAVGLGTVISFTKDRGGAYYLFDPQDLVQQMLEAIPATYTPDPKLRPSEGMSPEIVKALDKMTTVPHESDIGGE